MVKSNSQGKMTDTVYDSNRKVNYPQQIFDAMVERKTQDTLSMQITGELLVQMGINTGIVKTTMNLNGRQIILSLKKKQTTEFKSRGQTTLWFESLIPTNFNSVPVHAVLWQG